MKQLAGPSCFADWQMCWKVFKSSMIMLEAASVSALDAYEHGIKGLCDMFPHAWGIISVADDLCRSERWSRILDEYLELQEIGKAPEGFDEEFPWDVIIYDSAWGIGGQAHWWKQRVEHPANLGYQQGIQFLSATEGIPLNAMAGSKGAGRKGKDRVPDGGKSRRAAMAALPAILDKAPVLEADVDWSRRATEHCYLWAQRRCTKGQFDCPMGRIHDPPSKTDPAPRDKGAKGRGKKGAAAKAAAAAGVKPKGPAQVPPNPQSKRQRQKAERAAAKAAPHR